MTLFSRTDATLLDLTISAGSGGTGIRVFDVSGQSIEVYDDEADRLDSYIPSPVLLRDSHGAYTFPRTYKFLDCSYDDQNSQLYVLLVNLAQTTSDLGEDKLQLWRAEVTPAGGISNFRVHVNDIVAVATSGGPPTYEFMATEQGYTTLVQSSSRASSVLIYSPSGNIVTSLAYQVPRDITGIDAPLDTGRSFISNRVWQIYSNRLITNSSYSRRTISNSDAGKWRTLPQSEFALFGDVQLFPNNFFTLSPRSTIAANSDRFLAAVNDTRSVWLDPQGNQIGEYKRSFERFCISEPATSSSTSETTFQVRAEYEGVTSIPSIETFDGLGEVQSVSRAERVVSLALYADDLIDEFYTTGDLVTFQHKGINFTLVGVEHDTEDDYVDCEFRF